MVLFAFMGDEDLDSIYNPDALVVQILDQVITVGIPDPRRRLADGSWIVPVQVSKSMLDEICHWIHYQKPDLLLKSYPVLLWLSDEYKRRVESDITIGCAQ